MNKKLKIAIRLGERWTDKGLNKAARGEGRWGFNIAKMLIDAGHFIYLIADQGIYTKETKINENTFVLSIKEAQKFDQFDLYIDPCWGFTQSKVYADTKYTLGNVWFQESNEVFAAPNLICTTPYWWQLCKIQQEYNNNKLKVFTLPTPYGHSFKEYNSQNSGILFPARNLDEANYNKQALKVLESIKDEKEIYIINVKEESFKNRHQITGNFIFNYSLHYDDILTLFQKCKLNAVHGHSCMAPAAFQGCPSLIVKNTVLLLCEDLNIDKDLIVESNCSNLKYVLNILLNDPTRTELYTKALQQYFSYHLTDNCLKDFNNIITYLGLD